MRPLRVALIASARYSVSQPFAGGLEAHTWTLTEGLRRRGHHVTLYAGPRSGAQLGVPAREPRWPQLSPAARADVTMTAAESMNEHHAYLDYMLELAGPVGRKFDIVHNNSLHYIPVAMARAVATPMVTTLHTPPTPWLESAIQLAPSPVTFVAVSQHTARAWSHAVPDIVVVNNGVDLEQWPVGPGGGGLVWFGRLVAEKGPHLAIEAARRARLPLDLIGPRFDEDYFRHMVEPRLGDGVRYLGHLDQVSVAAKVGRASAALVTPCWDEPYGLVVAESLACGTPVAAFDRGGVGEIIDAESGLLVKGGDVDQLATAAVAACSTSRAAARSRAESACSVEQMLDGYEATYARLIGQVAA